MSILYNEMRLDFSMTCFQAQAREFVSSNRNVLLLSVPLLPFTSVVSQGVVVSAKG